MRSTFVAPLAILGAAVIALAPVAARDPVTPEQRIGRLEKQVRQMQRTLYPKGQPADTAGFDDAPAATQDSVNTMTTRIDALERQMAELVRTSEENGNRMSQMEADLARLRADSDTRLRAIENGAAQPPAATPDSGASADAATSDAPPPAEVADGPPPPSRPKVESGGRGSNSSVAPTAGLTGAEAAYDTGYKLWQAGKYDSAYSSLTKMAKDYPDSRRVSWAYNLAGRAQLDKGDYRAAAETLLTNYRRDPKGERAQDSLFYLGQSLVKLGQPSQACKAYAELEDVYAKRVRPDLKQLLTPAKAEARCH